MTRAIARPWLFRLCLVSLACCASEPPPEQDADPSSPGTGNDSGNHEPGTAILIGAGDIAGCDGNGDEQTADLLDNLEGTIFLAGDLGYDDYEGTYDEIYECFDSSWGRHRERMRPSPGNHEYYSESDAASYFAYFGEAAGEAGKGWYSYEHGSWHVIVLNSNCGPEEPRVECQVGSEQEMWLRADLAAHPTACTLAYWHHPRFSSGDHGNNDWMQPVWEALEEGGADLVISGHDHHYERFAAQDAEGNADPRGIRSFIAGTGGRGHYDLVDAKPNSEFRHTGTYGLLELALKPGSFDYRFVPVEGSVLMDEGSANCDNDRVLEP
jgi:hypothetical protein